MSETFKIIIGLSVFFSFIYLTIKLFYNETKINEAAFINSSDAINEGENKGTRRTHFEKNCDSSITEGEI